MLNIGIYACHQMEKHHEKHGFKPEWITEVKTTIGKEGG
jgi:hypothetical protein